MTMDATTVGAMVRVEFNQSRLASAPTPPQGQQPLANLSTLPLTAGTRLRFAPQATDATLVLASAFDKRQACRLMLGTPDKSWSYVLDAGFCSLGQRFHIAIPPGLDEVYVVEAMDEDSAFWVIADPVTLPNSLPGLWPRVPGIDRLGRFYERLEWDCVAEFGWMGGCVLEAFDGLARGAESARWQRARNQWLGFFLDHDHLIYQDPHGRRQVDTFHTIEATLPITTLVRTQPDHPIIDIALAFLGSRAGKDATCEGCYTVAYPLMQLAAVRGRADMQVQALAELNHRREHLVVGEDIYLRHHGDHRTYRNWARGVGWYLLGYAECVRLSDRQGGWAEAAEHLAERAAWVLANQRPDGLWSNFFYEAHLPPDTAGSAGLAAMLVKTHQLGLIGPEAVTAAQRCWDALQGWLHEDGWLGGTTPSNKRGEAAQHVWTRCSETFGMGLMGLLAASLATAKAE